MATANVARLIRLSASALRLDGCGCDGKPKKLAGNLDGDGGCGCAECAKKKKGKKAQGAEVASILKVGAGAL
jgi:hypothetical protein